MLSKLRIALWAGLFLASCGTASALTLGTFTFNDLQFGNSLEHSDGGELASQFWLNTVNADPGSPGYLTGPNVETGIADIGAYLPAIYTIGYDNYIFNDVGSDLGIIVARLSIDNFQIAVSADGVNFSTDQLIGAATGEVTGVSRTYFAGGYGPYVADLYVHPIELGEFGITEGSSIRAVRITSHQQGDLIRVAGMNASGVSAVPEPAPLPMVAIGAAAIAILGRKK